MNNPKVTIIMATYNRAHFIVETLKAIQEQTYANWECLIIDDGGTDNTSDVIAPILQDDNRFIFYKRNNHYSKGLPGCRNYGLDLAKGDYIIFFDDDDIPHPQNLEICVAELSKEAVLFCRYIRNVFFDQFDYNFDFNRDYSFFYIDEKDVEKMLINELPFNSCAVMWKKECFFQNRFVETLMYAEEWELYSRIVSSGIKGISIDKCLFYGRKHKESNTGEFYNNNPVRKASFVEAILLVLDNLKEKQRLSDFIIRYFVLMSTDYIKYDLFNKVMVVTEQTFKEKIKWKIVYYPLYVKMPLYRFFMRYKKRIKKSNFIKEKSRI